MRLKTINNATRAENRHWARFHGVPAALWPELRKLKRRLCRVSGERFQVNWMVNKEVEPGFAHELLHFGTFFKGKPSLLKLGKPNECHDNSHIWATKSYKYRRYKGFALSDDGIWRVHSWVMGPEGLIETTVKRTLYYGVPIPSV